MLSQLIIAVYLALFAAATPLPARNSLATLSLARRMNTIGPKKLVELDRSRAKSLIQRATQKSRKSASPGAGVSFPLANLESFEYIATVQVGNPPTYFSLIVDTGSSNTWVGANSSNPYTPTSTSYDTGDPVYVAYGTGFFIGTEFIDQVSLGEGFTISQQSIGVANASADFNGTDGILGIGPTDLTADTVRNSGLVPTVFDNAFTQGLIDKKIMSIFFEPTNGILEQNGELTFGGIDESKFTGNITFVNITTTSPSNQYYGINQTVHYGNTTILDNKAGIVDTGTSLFLLATEAFNTYQQLTGGVMNETLGLLSITPQQYENLQSLFLEIGGRRFELTRNAQIFPRSLNTAIGGTADSIYLVVAGTGTPLGEGLDFLNGQVMLERFFLVIDAENSQVGLATTQFTNATTN